MKSSSKRQHRQRPALAASAAKGRRSRFHLERLEPRLCLATYTVTNTLDAGDGSLRAAVLLANNTPGADTILFDSSFSTPQTITLKSQLTLSDSAMTTIQGPGAGLLAVGGNKTFRVYEIGLLKSATISGLSIVDGKSSDRGGGVATQGTTTLIDCVISGCQAKYGGGVAVASNYGRLTMRGCTVSGNYAPNGGGIDLVALTNNPKGPTAELINCTISGNVAGSRGGGVGKEAGILTMVHCTVSDNKAGYGGGLFAASDYKSDGSLKLGRNIIGGNRTYSGSAVSGKDVFIVGGSKTLQSLGRNLIGTTGGSKGEGKSSATLFWSWVASDLLDRSSLGLAPLGFYGGSMKTMALLPGSPAINAGGDQDNAVAKDQRGFDRPGGRPDIGAFEYDATLGLVVSTTADGYAAQRTLSLRDAVNLANVMKSDDTITFSSFLFDRPQTITLKSQLTLTDSATTKVVGPMASLTLSGNNATTVLGIKAGAKAILSDVTLSGGMSSGDGGGVLNEGTAEFTDCTIKGNTALNGGGIFNTGTLAMTRCTIMANKATTGGGMYNANEAKLTNCTIATNTATSSAGLRNNKKASLFHCTVSSNSASASAGGVGSLDGFSTEVHNTIIAGNTAPSAFDVSGAFQPLGTNLIGISNGSSGWRNSDKQGTLAKPLNPGLKPLANYGGPTETMPLQADSAAINAGGTSSSIPTLDQRGLGRVGVVDIGACEFSNGWIVNTTLDAGATALQTTLPTAMAYANAYRGTDQNFEISFDPAVFSTHQNIHVKSRALRVTNSVAVRIAGPGARLLSVTGNFTHRVFVVDKGAVAAISGIEIAYGKAESVFAGGGVYNEGVTSLTDCMIYSNEAVGAGGGISNAGTITMTGCTILANKAATGGGMYNTGSATLTNCTITENTATSSAGLRNNKTALLVHCTVSRNSASASAGGISNRDGYWNTILGIKLSYVPAASTTVLNTIVAGNSAKSASDVSGAFSSLGTNLIGISDGSSGWRGSDKQGTLLKPIDPKLILCSDFGGPTWTMLPETGSPAINSATTGTVAGIVIPVKDQRGAARGAMPDIGAVELLQTRPTMLLTFQKSSIVFGETASVTVTLRASPSDPTGTIFLTVDNGKRLSGTLVNGACTFSIAGLPVGRRYVTARYEFQGSFETVDANASLIVKAA